MRHFSHRAAPMSITRRAAPGRSLAAGKRAGVAFLHAAPVAGAPPRSSGGDEMRACLRPISRLASPIATASTGRSNGSVEAGAGEDPRERPCIVVAARVRGEAVARHPFVLVRYDFGLSRGVVTLYLDTC